MQADEATAAAVHDAVQRLLKVYEAGDAEAVAGLLVDDPCLVMIGTAADEVRRGPAEARAQFDRDMEQSEARSLTLEWTSVSASGAVAWMAGGVTVEVTAGAEQLRFPIRLSLVLLRDDAGAWKVAQAHFSTPDASTPERQSFPEAAG
ncbi:MAG TPA: nuclear transport factor 2 family protein [Actinomycetota bacterium]|nr:nuclear transport factor 2 family protein [Actinomycetota bacterium]